MNDILEAENRASILRYQSRLNRRRKPRAGPMFLEQQFIIQQAVRLISRLPAGARWMLTATDEDGVEQEDAPETAASLSIVATRDILPAVMSITTGQWEEEVIPEDGTIYYWRAEGDLEITIEIEE